VKNLNLVKIVGFVVIIFITISILSGLFYTVDAGEKGVLLKFGKVFDVVDPGLHFKIPIVENVIKMSTRVEKIDVHGEAASKDLQSIVTTLTVNVMIRPDKVSTIYETLKSDYQITIVGPVMQEIFKAVTAQYNAEELITKRELIRTQIFDNAKKKLAGYNLILDNISITNFAFSKGYSEAIEQKQVAEQNSKKAEYDFQRIEVEAKQTIAKAQAEAKALSLQREAVTDQLIELRKIEVQRVAIEKWDGHLPTTTGGAMPFINVGK
jgi:regulator of protease activity HflC (stomatin/prohibitin superfamily)